MSEMGADYLQIWQDMWGVEPDWRRGELFPRYVARCAFPDDALDDPLAECKYEDVIEAPDEHHAEVALREAGWIEDDVDGWICPVHWRDVQLGRGR